MTQSATRVAVVGMGARVVCFANVRLKLFPCEEAPSAAAVPNPQSAEAAMTPEDRAERLCLQCARELVAERAGCEGVRRLATA